MDIIDTKDEKKLDLTTVKNAVNSLIVCKILESQDIVTQYLSIENPIAKLLITYGIFNAQTCFNVFNKFFWKSISGLKVFGRYSNSLLFKQYIPTKKTYEISYLRDNEINQIYLAYNWYLKTVAKKPIENHIVLQMHKQVQASKEEVRFEIQKSVPRDTETTFTYSGHTFNYSITEFEDVIYGVGGEIKKKNYKLLIWTFDNTDYLIDDMTRDILNLFAKSKLDDVWKQKIFNHKNGSWEEASIDRQKRKITSVVLDNNSQKDIESELKYFVENETWFNDKNIPYKKSYLFYGPPGTGKTSMIRAISHELQRHIYYLNLANIKNDDELTRLMGKLNFTEVALIIEDIDAQTDAVKNRASEDIEVINNNGDKETRKEKSGITLAGLLNQIDGVQNNYGMILIMTTNRPDDLDPALTREGRVDHKVFFNYASDNQMYEMFKRFYDDNNTITLKMIQDWRKNNMVKIAPAAIENVMVKNYKDCTMAFNALKKYKGPMGDMQKFEY